MKIPIIKRILLILFLCFCWSAPLNAAPDFTKTPVIFVHGYGLSADSWSVMISELTTSGYPESYLSAIQLVPNDGANIAAAENQIAPFIENFLSEINTFLSAEYPNIPLKTKVDLVSHSMGGLSSRWYAAKGRPDRVRKWISLAGANHGTNDLCGWGTPGADDLCPAFAESLQASRVQYELNGAPRLPDVDETPFGIGVDSAGVTSIAPDSNRRILYVTIRTSPDEWIDPDDSVILDGTGGIDILIPSVVQAIQTSPGNFLMTNGVGHDPMLADDDTIKLVRSILEIQVQRSEIIGTWRSGIWYFDVAVSKWTQMHPTPPAGDIAAGDFTGDGKADVASIWDSGLWYQDGTTSAWTKVSGAGSVNLAAGDVTGDGRSEIISTSISGIWYFDVAASKWTKMHPTPPDGDIAAGDFTGDGKADVASCWSNGLWYQNGDTLDWVKVSNTAPTQVTAGDVTGDGRFEIIGTWSNGIWYWDVAASKWTKMSSDIPTGDIAAGDFTGDGKADVASSWDSGLWYQDGASLDWTKVSGSAPDRLTAGDITGN